MAPYHSVYAFHLSSFHYVDIMVPHSPREDIYKDTILLEYFAVIYYFIFSC